MSEYIPPASPGELRHVIRREIRRTVPVPIIRDTDQVDVGTPTPIGRSMAPTWLIDYNAADDTTPTGDTPAWTVVQAGSPTVSITLDILTLTAAATTDSLYYAITDASIEDAAGLAYEAMVKIVSDGCAVNQGLALSLCGGTFRNLAWIRGDGCNLDGEPDVPFDFTDDFHRVELVVQGANTELRVDGALLQAGGPANPSTDTKATLGTWVAL